MRSPSTANGIAGLKPTLGLLSRDGIVPLALSFDTAGPMARHVYDVAAALGVMTGVDPADEATAASGGRFETDYTRHLDADALAGARIGVARDFLGQDGDVDWVVEASLDVMREAGATIVDVRLPRWLLEASGDFYTVVRYREFRAQIAEYLATLEPRFHASLADLVKRSVRLASPADGAGHNPGRWSLMRREDASGELSDAEYRAVVEHGLPMVRTVIRGLMDADDLAAIVYPTSPRRPGRVDVAPRAHRRGRPLGDAVRQPHRLSGFSSCRPGSRATAFPSASRSWAGRSTSLACSPSATPSSRRRRRDGSRCTHRCSPRDGARRRLGPVGLGYRWTG